MRWTPERIEELRELWNSGLGKSKIARKMGVTRNSIIGESNRLNLQYRNHKHPVRLADDHPAVIEGRSIFPGQVVEPEGDVLKPGGYQRKLGAMVTKGRWSGMPLYSLSLEERATCPRSCSLYGACYGNAMHRAKRYRHGPALDLALAANLARLSVAHKGGFVVRLHLVGDFVSIQYTLQWIEWLRKFPALRVFGYTAHEVSTPIGALLRATANAHWDRFAIRTSGALRGLRTVVVDTYEDAERIGAIVCPAQSDKLAAAGKQISCSSCALCWSTQRPVAFLLH